MEERLWKRYKWTFPPEDETKSCWWVVNLNADDQTSEVRLICRSVACLRVELCSSRIASTHKLRQEWDRRLDNNALAVDQIQQHRDLWFQAGGCDPEELATPTEHMLDCACNTINTLDKMLDLHGPKGGLDSFVEELSHAVRQIKVVSWEAIQRDRFHLTPDGMYNELVRNTEHIISSWGGDCKRREARMSQPLDQDDEAKAEEDKEVKQTSGLRKTDKYGLDLCLECML